MLYIYFLSNKIISKLAIPDHLLAPLDLLVLLEQLHLQPHQFQDVLLDLPQDLLRQALQVVPHPPVVPQLVQRLPQRYLLRLMNISTMYGLLLMCRSLNDSSTALLWEKREKILVFLAVRRSISLRSSGSENQIFSQRDQFSEERLGVSVGLGWNGSLLLARGLTQNRSGGLICILIINLQEIWIKSGNYKQIIIMFDDYVSTDDIHEYFSFKETLGEGAFAEVRKAIYIEENQTVAVKCIDKKRINEEDLKLYKNQCEIMIYLEHPNIVHIYEVYDNPEYFYIVMEYMEGGELYDKKNLHRCRTEGQICQIVRTITDALDFCHSKRIVHRDIKPQNILWSTNDSEAILKIADFGFAKISNDCLMTTACGTPMFFSPEILQRKPYDQAVDFWSLGVITYILGRSPFESDDEDELFKRIKLSKVEFPPQYWKYISTSAKDFINKLLEKNPKKRYSGEQIRRHPWINADHTEVVTYVEREQNIWQFEAERKIGKLRTIINMTLDDIKSESLMDSRLLNTLR